MVGYGKGWRAVGSLSAEVWSIPCPTPVYFHRGSLYERSFPSLKAMGRALGSPSLTSGGCGSRVGHLAPPWTWGLFWVPPGDVFALEHCEFPFLHSQALEGFCVPTFPSVTGHIHPQSSPWLILSKDLGFCSAQDTPGAAPWARAVPRLGHTDGAAMDGSGLFELGLSLFLGCLNQVCLSLLGLIEPGFISPFWSCLSQV